MRNTPVRHGTVLIAVMILLALGAMVAVGILSRASARLDQARVRLDHMQARSLAQSGLEGVLVEMAGQRGKMLAGESPQLTAEWTTSVSGMGAPRVGRVRLLSLAQTEEGTAVVALSQGACADVLALPSESLKRLLGEKAGGAIVAARGGRISSVLGAMNEAGLGMDATVKWGGDLEASEDGDAGAMGASHGASGEGMSALERAKGRRIVRGSRDGGRPEADAHGAEGAPALLVRDAISVGSFDPIGVWNGNEMARVDLSGAIDSSEVDEIAKQFEDAFAALGASDAAGDGAAPDSAAQGTAKEPAESESAFEKRAKEDESTSKGQAARVSQMMAKIFDSDSPPKKTSDLLKAMRKAGAPPGAWRLAWGVRFGDDLYSRGRVDINRAPREVLAAVPGIDATVAEAIVARRAGLSADALMDPTWPARQGVMAPEQLERAADWITTRSLQWRVRIEAAVLDAKDAEEQARGGEAGGGSSAQRPVSVVTLEIVVDAAAERVRVAYLRDVSLEAAVAQVERSQKAAEEEAADSEVEEEAAAKDDTQAAPDRARDALDDLKDRSRPTTRAERLAERSQRDAESGRVRRGDASARRAGGNLRGERAGDASAPDAAQGEEESTRASRAGDGENGEKPRRPARRELEARDNRTGRWRP